MGSLQYEIAVHQHLRHVSSALSLMASARNRILGLASDGADLNHDSVSIPSIARQNAVR
jgi:hypothetical protein